MCILYIVYKWLVNIKGNVLKIRYLKNILISLELINFIEW